MKTIHAVQPNAPKLPNDWPADSKSTTVKDKTKPRKPRQTREARQAEADGIIKNFQASVAAGEFNHLPDDKAEGHVVGELTPAQFRVMYTGADGVTTGGEGVFENPNPEIRIYDGVDACCLRQGDTFLLNEKEYFVCAVARNRYDQIIVGFIDAKGGGRSGNGMPAVLKKLIVEEYFPFTIVRKP